MEKAVLQSAKFTSPTCPEDVYLSDSDIGGSMTNILINRNMCTGCQITLKLVSI